MRLPFISPGLRLTGIGLAVGAVAGAGIATILYEDKRRRQPVRQGSGSGSGPVFKYGAPVADVLRQYDQFGVLWDTRLRNPRWVLERVTKETSSGAGNRANVLFEEDSGIDVRFRNRLTDFQMSGYDRGHMAPAADHKGSQRALEQTFTLTNISPQVGKGFNRDYWARFEHFVKGLTNTCEEVFVVTGPLFLPKLTSRGYTMAYPMIGEVPNLVAVPTHFFKVVLAESKERNLLGAKPVVVGAFVMPNNSINPDTPLTAFSVPLESLESASGLRFFPEFLTPPRRAALDAAALGWQRDGRKAGRNVQESNFFLDSQPVSVLPAARLLEEPAKKKRGRPRKERAPAPEDETPVVDTLKGGWGTIHVCDHTVCNLPREEFWKASKEAAVEHAPVMLQRSNSTGSNNGGGRKQ
mmetsp:Transcript_1435/g.4274  ORF Transcript_1435/g.4274 Transcript_1435/m.4274 type:complete len:410 (-) Transcript_1435:16-1245(-)